MPSARIADRVTDLIGIGDAEGGALRVTQRGQSRDLDHRDGFEVRALCWVLEAEVAELVTPGEQRTAKIDTHIGETQFVEQVRSKNVGFGRGERPGQLLRQPWKARDGSSEWHERLLLIERVLQIARPHAVGVVELVINA